MELVILGLIGLFAGISGGIFGIGGGIIIVPALVAFLGFAQKKAQGTSLVALLMPVGILGVKNYYDANQLDFKAGGIIATTFLVGAFLGSKLVVGMDDTTVRKMFACFLGIVAIYMFFKK